MTYPPLSPSFYTVLSACRCTQGIFRCGQASGKSKTTKSLPTISAVGGVNI